MDTQIIEFITELFELAPRNLVKEDIFDFITNPRKGGGLEVLLPGVYFYVMLQA
jgi:hypothetical protein